MTDAEFNDLCESVLSGRDSCRDRLYSYVYEEAMYYLRWKGNTYAQLRRMRYEDVALDILIMFADKLPELENPARYLKTITKYHTLKVARDDEKYRSSAMLYESFWDYGTTEQYHSSLDDDDRLRLSVAQRVLKKMYVKHQKLVRMRLDGMCWGDIADHLGYANRSVPAVRYSQFRKQVKQEYKRIAA